MSNDHTQIIHYKPFSTLISPLSLPSNDCLNLIFMYKFDKRQAVFLPLRRLCKSANKYYQKQYVLSRYSRPQKKLVINHTTDHVWVNKNLSKMSSVYDLTINFNINLNTWREKIYAFDKDKQKQTNNAFKVLSYFLTEYDLMGFSLNFQLMLKNFDLLKAQQLVPKSQNLQYVSISCSELQITSLIVLSQIPNIKKLEIHETLISHCSQNDINQIKDQLKPNDSIKEFIFYKNQLCTFGQQVIFRHLLPYLTNLQKLKIPTNQLKDNIIDDILQYFKAQKSQNIRTLNIGNNHFKIEGLSKFLTYLTQECFSLKKLELSFQQFQTPEAFKSIIDIIKESKTIEIYDFEGCNLSLQDVELLNNLLISKKDNMIKQLRLGLNKFTEEQLTQRFRGDSFSEQSTTESSLSDDERVNHQDQSNININESPIMDVIERPIETFQSGLLRKLKMY